MDTTEPLVGDRASPPLRKRSNQDEREEPPAGVYGVGVRQGGNDDYDSDFDEEVRRAIPLLCGDDPSHPKNSFSLMFVNSTYL